jgi:hypothetical protein
VNITRAEAINVISGLLNRRLFDARLEAEYGSLYPDLPASHWAFRDVIEASVRHDCTRASDGSERWVSG